MNEVKNMNKEKLKNPYDIIHEYESDLKGFSKIRWNISGVLSDIYVWCLCMYYKVFK